MKVKNILKNILFIGCFQLALSSCADWLKVDMEDGIMEDALYSDNEGFLIALNGVYSSMNETYSSTWSMGAIDVMAQYYNVPANGTHPYKVYASHNYTDNSFEETSGALWIHLYKLLANLNVLLEHCDKEGSAISARYYPIVKGEALALRAMIHFDLLRFYGPIYSESTASAPAIPYLDIPNNKDIVPLSTAKGVCDKLMKDLNEAAKLLEEDPIRKEGVTATEPENPQDDISLKYRQYRLNYYAVQGLLTRLHLWMGNKTEAYQCVSKLIREIENNKTFPWVTKEDATSPNTPDRVFSTEVMFGLYNTSRENLFDKLFGQAQEGNALTFVGGISGENSKIEQFYGKNSSSDYRRKMWEEVIISGEGETSEKGGITYFLKYEKTGTEKTFKYMIPLMRVSEMYLAMAECSNDLKEVAECLHKIRWHRNLTQDEEVSPENKMKLITEEFAREVIGEGQLFYYYKRNSMEEIPSGTDCSNPFNMLLSSYVVPLPKVESDNRQ